jgi:hypothetical protein
MRLGIEMEFWTVDETGRLCSSDGLVDAHDGVHPEFIEPLVEVKTEPHESERALRRELQRTLLSVLETADALGTRLVPLGTPLTTISAPATTERGRLFERVYGEGVVSAKNCAGTHVHFEKGEVGRQLNLLTALDPAISLVNSSPYYRGERAVNSARAAAYRGECGAAFERYCDLWSYVDGVGEWRSRVERAYRDFHDLAVERGVDRRLVDEWFDPEDAMLNPVRLREELPTVEWRAPDTALPDQVVRLAFTVRDLVSQTSEKPVVVGGGPERAGVRNGEIRVPDFPSLSSLSDEAIRTGLDSGRVRSYLDSMGFDTTAYHPLANRFDVLDTLDEAVACELRLAYADRLRADVAALAERSHTPRDPDADSLLSTPG